MKFSKRVKASFLALGFASVAAVAQAAPVNGNIAFGGSYELDGENFLDSTTLFFNDSLVVNSTGDFDQVQLGTLVDMQDLVFDPAFDTNDNFWTFSFNGVEYSFHLKTLEVTQREVDNLDLSGTGWLSATGFDDTAGEWMFSAQNGFSFSSATDTTAAVSEPGSLALLSLALMFAGYSARRKTS